MQQKNTTLAPENQEKTKAQNVGQEFPWFLKEPNPEIYLSDNHIIVDFETTNIEFGNPVNPQNRLVMGVSKYRGEVRSHWGSEYEMQELLDLIAQADFVVAQNAKFELGWLRRCGADLSKLLIYDPLIGEYVRDGNRRSARNLDALAARYGVELKEQFVSQLIHMGVCPSQIVPGWLEEYCKQDVETTEQVFLNQRVKLDADDLLPCVYTRCLLTPVLADIEFNGMQLDPERVNVLYNKAKKEHEAISADLARITGGINTNSSKQLAEFLYDRLGFSEPTDHRGNTIRTASGKRVTDKANIARLRARNQEQRNFIALYLKENQLDSLRTKYLNKFKECVDKDGGLMHARFNQTVTQTHRLSSTGGKYKTQFQNMDRNLKPLYKARNPGWLIGESDEAQLEYRVAVWLGDDQEGRKKIAEKYDVHTFTASVLNDIPFAELLKRVLAEEPVAKEMRQNAKPDTFKPLYGGKTGTEAQMRYYKAFQDTYPGITGTQDKWIKTVLKNKMLVMPHGFRFYWPDTKVLKSGYIQNTTQICNYPVQHFATAEIVVIGVVYMWHRMQQRKMQSFLINTVHDSVIGEIHPQEVELFQELSVKALTVDVIGYLQEVYGVTFDVPLEVECKTKSHWTTNKNWEKKYLDPNTPLVS